MPGSTYRGRRRRRSNPPFPASLLIGHGPWPRNTRALAPLVGGWIEARGDKGGKECQCNLVHVRKLVTHQGHRRMPKCLDRARGRSPSARDDLNPTPSRHVDNRQGFSVHGAGLWGARARGRLEEENTRRHGGNGGMLPRAVGDGGRSERATRDPSRRPAGQRAGGLHSLSADRNKVDCPQNWRKHGRGSRGLNLHFSFIFFSLNC